MFAQHYIERFTEKRELIKEAPSFDLNISVVIPAFNESNIQTSLESIEKCDPTNGSVEIIVVLNYSDALNEKWKDFHENQFEILKQWSIIHSKANRKFHILLERLPAKHAGVGLARKIGMDEAARRFNILNKSEGIITGFDADSICMPNYLQEIENFFSKKKLNGCSINFEHPLEGSDYEPRIYQSIQLYELYLRYYISGLRYAGLPYAYHTIGSSFAVSAEAYCKQGGMNRLKAGEDFYFLNKIIALGNYYNLNTTTVIPSPRTSDRVPFGTGAAITKIIESCDNQYLTFNPQVFRDIKILTQNISIAIESNNSFISSLNECLQKFLLDKKIENKLNEIRQNCSTPENFKKRFFQWFDGLMALQYFNYTFENVYKPLPIKEASATMLEMLGFNPKNYDILTIIETFRAIDKYDF